MNKVEDNNKTTKVEEKKVEAVVEKVKQEKKIEVKDKAVAYGNSMRVSPKDCMAICKVIMHKSPQDAIKRLEDVLKMKRVIPMAGREVPHKKGHGIAGATYPMNACKAMINLIKQIDANATVNGIENPVISLAMANFASRPFRKGGTRAKRANVKIEAISKVKLAEKKK